VRLHARSLNFHDYGVVNTPNRVSDRRIPMSDGGGIVEAIGERVTEFEVGDHVVSCFSRALAMIEAAAPKDAIEAALAVQMACTHTAAMAVLAKLDVAFATERRVAAFGSAAARLMRAYATQVEVLRRLRNGGQQFVRVEHVHVNDGGQAIIGNVQKRDEQQRTT